MFSVNLGDKASSQVEVGGPAMEIAIVSVLKKNENCATEKLESAMCTHTDSFLGKLYLKKK